MTNNTTATALTERQRMDLLLVADDMSVSGDAKLADALRALLTSPRAAVPDGWRLVRVNQHFDALIEALERADDKGYLPNAMRGAWEEFECDENIDAAPAAPVAEYDGNHVQNHCTECNEHEAECSCDQAVAAPGAKPAHCQCPACIDGATHASDCAVHNEPAYPNGPCNCGSAQAVAADGEAIDTSVLARLSAQITGCPLNPTLSKFARAVEANVRAAVSPATADTTWTAPKQHCQNGGDVCLSGSHDGVACPEDSCDIDDGIRKNPATADERAAWLQRTVLEIADQCGISGEALARLANIVDTRDVALLHKLTTPIVQTLRASQAAAPASKTLSCMQDEIAGVMQQHMEGNAGVVAINTCALAVARHVMQQAAAPAEAREPIYQTCFMQGQWRDVDRGEYERAKSLHDDLARIVYAVPADAGEAVAREPDGWHYRERVDGQWTEWKPCGKSTVERYQYASDMQFAPVYRVPAEAGESVVRQVVIDWAVERWTLEVKDRPLNNVNRRPLDDAWRQLIRYLGADDISLLGPRHDELLAARAQGAQGGKGGEA